MIIDNKRRIHEYRKRSEDIKNLDESHLHIERDSQIEYYKFLREEIKREDEITNYRTTWTIAIQGFLINATGITLVFDWSHSPPGVSTARKFLILIFILVGIYMGFASLIGVLASRRSIEEAKTEWEKRNRVWNLFPNFVPQTFGQKNAFSMGTMFSIATPIGFITLWCLIAIGYFALWIYNKNLFLN